MKCIAQTNRHSKPGVSNSNWLGGRIWPIFEMAGRIRPMSWVGGPQKSSRKALRVLLTIIFFTFRRYLFISSKIVQERLQKNRFFVFSKIKFDFWKLFEGRIGASRGPHVARGPRVWGRWSKLYFKIVFRKKNSIYETGKLGCYGTFCEITKANI